MQLKLNGIAKSFGSKKVLRDVSYTFDEGKIYGLLGRNGADKTTLFNCLTDEVTVDGGRAALLAPPAPERALTPEDVDYVLSTPVLPDFLTGYEYVKFFMEVNAGQGEGGKTPDDWLEVVSLEPEDRHRLIRTYSQGMKNKLQMLGCFIARPPVLLLDEPLTSLDVVVALEMKKMLQAMKPGRVLLMSTHILQLATDLCDEIVVLHEGRLEGIDHATLHSADFEERLVEILRDEEVE
jgi:ABC-2 type transport system ATP-binding protein